MPTKPYDKLLIHPQALRNEFASLDVLGVSIAKFGFEEIRGCDLSIWEAQAKGPALKPGLREQRHQT